MWRIAALAQNAPSSLVARTIQTTPPARGNPENPDMKVDTPVTLGKRVVVDADQPSPPGTGTGLYSMHSQREDHRVQTDSVASVVIIAAENNDAPEFAHSVSKICATVPSHHPDSDERIPRRGIHTPNSINA